MNACRVLYTVVRSTPCLSTLSRSTWAKYCGVAAMKVVNTEANSGRLRTAARNLLVCSARNGTSAPLRSSSMKLTPPEVPTPGMAGGEKEMACASGQLAEPAVQLAHDDVRGEALRRALVPRLQGDEVEGAVGRVDPAQQAEADHRVVALHARGLLQDALDLPSRPRRCAAATPPRGAARSCRSSPGPPRARSSSAAASRRTRPARR